MQELDPDACCATILARNTTLPFRGEAVLKKDSIAFAVATWFGSGLMRPRLWGCLRSGTYGSIFALPLWLIVMYISTRLPTWGSVDVRSYYGIITGAVLFLGSWSVPYAGKRLGPRTDWRGRTKTRDQNEIVIDEVAGMLVACAPLIDKKGWVLFFGFIAALALFRFFDIVKVWPTAYFDRQKSSEAVMLDDVVAGVYAALVLITLSYFFRL